MGWEEKMRMAGFKLNLRIWIMISGTAGLSLLRILKRPSEYPGQNLNLIVETMSEILVDDRRYIVKSVMMAQKRRCVYYETFQTGTIRSNQLDFLCRNGCFSPLVYPGYDWLSMAVSDLSAVGAPSADLANRLNALFAPCGIVSIMAVCVSMEHVREKLLRLGIYIFCAMEWVCNVGYEMFPWVSGADGANPQNIMHLDCDGTGCCFFAYFPGTDRGEREKRKT